MTSDRIKEIQETTAFPNSLSVAQALFKVWNECEQGSTKYSEKEMRDYGIFYFTHQNKSMEYLGKDLFKIWAEQNKTEER